MQACHQTNGGSLVNWPNKKRTLILLNGFMDGGDISHEARLPNMVPRNLIRISTLHSTLPILRF